ncbi:MAG TPA: DnaJ domain-containing protein [Thermoanaerobaculia bacterium]|jgi:curved DNA-binding protein CbpA|nr:DnaJ domain-containing protein [Thermoanaerobaculia bacterium]
MEAPAGLSNEEVRLFIARVERGLLARPLGLDPTAHRQLVAELVGRVGEASFYDLLAVSPGASDEEVHAAYDRLARLVHPSHARSLGLAGKEGVLELLFERATQGYLTLSHPDRRKRYDSELGADVWTAGSSGSARTEEERQVARRYFVKANVLAASEEYHQAIDLLRTAARIDPRSEYYALLGQLEAKNPHWLRLAEDNLVRAIELGGPNQGLEAALAHVREQKAAAAGEALPPGKPGDGDPPSGLKRLFRR